MSMNGGVGGPADPGARGSSFVVNGGSGHVINVGGNGASTVINNSSSTGESGGQQDDESNSSDDVEQPIICGGLVHLPTDLIPFALDAIDDKHVRKYIRFYPFFTTDEERNGPHRNLG